MQKGGLRYRPHRHRPTWLNSKKCRIPSTLLNHTGIGVCNGMSLLEVEQEWSSPTLLVLCVNDHICLLLLCVFLSSNMRACSANFAISGRPKADIASCLILGNTEAYV